jgi:CubicO group peptidase (beta-lactamase class C family)
VASFNAVLRDYARLGRSLAHDGAWDGKQIVPAQWMIDATTVRASDGYLLSGAATKRFCYGYLLWLFPGERRQFALLGYKGRYVCVDPTAKVVMVHTAIEDPVHRDEPWGPMAGTGRSARLKLGTNSTSTASDQRTKPLAR